MHPVTSLGNCAKPCWCISFLRIWVNLRRLDCSTYLHKGDTGTSTISIKMCVHLRIKRQHCVESRLRTNALSLASASAWCPPAQTAWKPAGCASQQSLSNTQPSASASNLQMLPRKARWQSSRALSGSKTFRKAQKTFGFHHPWADRPQTMLATSKSPPWHDHMGLCRQSSHGLGSLPMWSQAICKQRSPKPLMSYWMHRVGSMGLKTGQRSSLGQHRFGWECSKLELDLLQANSQGCRGRWSARSMWSWSSWPHASHGGQCLAQEQARCNDQNPSAASARACKAWATTCSPQSTTHNKPNTKLSKLLSSSDPHTLQSIWRVLKIYLTFLFYCLITYFLTLHVALCLVFYLADRYSRNLSGNLISHFYLTYSDWHSIWHYPRVPSCFRSLQKGSISRCARDRDGDRVHTCLDWTKVHNETSAARCCPKSWQAGRRRKSRRTEGKRKREGREEEEKRKTKGRE